MPNWLTLSNAADLVSLVQVILSLIILYNVKHIRTQFLFAARVPQLTKSLEEHASNLSAQYRDLENSIDLVKTELARCQSVLRSLASKLKGDSRASVRRLIGKIEAERKTINAASGPIVWEIYTELTVLIEDMKQIEEDRKWRA